MGRGIGDQIGLACKVSPFTGSRRLGVARALHADLPATRALLAAGLISEDIATLVVAQTSHLDAEQRRLVDVEVGIVIPVDALLHPEQPDRPDDDTDHREHPEQQRWHPPRQSGGWW